MQKRAYHQYTTGQVEFLTELWRIEWVPMPELFTAFNRRFNTQLTKQQIKACLSRQGIKTKRPRGCKKGQVHSGSFAKGNIKGNKRGIYKPEQTPWNKIVG